MSASWRSSSTFGHGADVLVPRFVARVDHVEQEIRVGRLLEGRAERGEEVLRQVADEAHRVGDHDLALAPAGPPAPERARARVERREELVLGERRPRRSAC